MRADVLNPRPPGPCVGRIRRGFQFSFGGFEESAIESTAAFEAAPRATPNVAGHLNSGEKIHHHLAILAGNAHNLALR